jgi:hypothetical protein
MNTLDTELERVYRNTAYKAPALDLEIRIGQHAPSLDALLKQYNAAAWAFITAYNPGVLLAVEQNLALLEELRPAIEGYRYFEGEGVGEDENWLPEKSFLVIGMSREEAIKLGKQFNQNAIVFGRMGEPAELLILV